MSDHLHDAIQRAAGELPEGWQIRLSVELGGGGIELIDAQGNEVEFPSNHESLAETVCDALDEALAQQQGGE